MHSEELKDLMFVHDSDQEIITVNKSKLIDDIVNLLIVVFITGVSIGVTIMHLIIRFS